MDSENLLYKTAELVRDATGCYYFICLQCGKDFENLDDIVDHIEKYFYESADDNNVDLLSPMTINPINESDWTTNDDDVETTVTNIKKESFEEYEDYKLSIPQMYQEDNEPARRDPIHCPLCSKTLSKREISLESHLMKVHQRSRKDAKIYECKICGRNTFTRSYDLDRHQLIHTRYAAASSTAESARYNQSENLKRKRDGDSNENSVLFNILNQSIKNPMGQTLQKSNVGHSANVSFVKRRKDTKSYMPINQHNVHPTTQQHAKRVEGNGNETFINSTIKGKTSSYCAICQSACSKNETLESHLMRVHRRNKQYAKVYQCKLCGKNTFTRPYDLRRHELTHLVKSRKHHKASLPNKFVKTEPKTDNKANFIPPVPLTRPLPETQSVSKVKQSASPIQATSPEKNSFLCAICNQKFESCLDVTMHLKFVHNQKRIYKCSHQNCAAGSFADSFFLHRHELSHSVHYDKVVGDIKNRVKCVFCRRNFSKKWNLLKHEKRHLVEMSQR